MAAIANFFTNISNDVEYLFKNPEMEADIAKSRVSSLALRVLGGCLIAFAACSLLTNLSTLPVSPITSLVGIGASLLVATIGYDMIIMGDNMRRIANFTDGAHLQNRSFIDQLFGVGRSIMDVARASAYELQNDLPYIFRGTILVDPFIRWIKEESKSMNHYDRNY